MTKRRQLVPGGHVKDWVVELVLIPNVYVGKRNQRPLYSVFEYEEFALDHIGMILKHNKNYKEIKLSYRGKVVRKWQNPNIGTEAR